MSNILSLYDFNRLIKRVIEGSMSGTHLITAEIASLNVKNHCYMNLVDKEDETIRAEMGAVIWAGRFRSIAKTFEKQTGTKLARGIKILFEAEITFHERYGLKLNIVNIDPSYTIGEMAARRREILEKLAKEGLIEKNSELPFPLVPQRIGIISSSTAAGYEDLMTHLENNSYGYVFDTRLYEAIMQGDRAEASIVSALKQCSDNAAQFDLLVIVRGGGGQTDLHCFDSYEIGKAIAMMPLPVISGIGHQRDVTVVDEVSNARAKTPTAVADMIINRVKAFEDKVDVAAHNLVRSVGDLVTAQRESLTFLAHNLVRSASVTVPENRERLTALTRRIELATRNEITENSHRIKTCIKGLSYALRFIKNEEMKLEAKERSVNYLDPHNVLQRGYSVTYHNGSIIKSAADVKAGESIETVLFKGKLRSTVDGKRRRAAKKKVKTEKTEQIQGLFD